MLIFTQFKLSFIFSTVETDLTRAMCSRTAFPQVRDQIQRQRRTSESPGFSNGSCHSRHPTPKRNTKDLAELTYLKSRSRSDSRHSLQSHVSIFFPHVLVSPLDMANGVETRDTNLLLRHRVLPARGFVRKPRLRGRQPAAQSVPVGAIQARLLEV